MNRISRDVFVTRNGAIKAPIDYVQATNAIPIEFVFRDWTIPEGAEARVYVQKPSGKSVYNTATITGNKIVVDVTDQTFAETGMSSLQVRIVKSERTLVTFAHPVCVEVNRVPGNAQESQNESDFLDEYIEKMDTTIEASKVATQAANTATSTANAATTAANTATQAANTATSEADTATTKANTAADNANAKAIAANTAAQSANKAAEDIQKKANAGDFTGSVTIGNVTTGEPGTKASVTNRGTKKDAILDMSIPRGATGEVENIDTVAVGFTQAGSRTNINTGETFAILFGKIKKFFADLKTVAFTGSYTDLTNKPTLGTAAAKGVSNTTTQATDGYVLDARQGKALEDKKLNKTSVVNSLLTTEAGFALDARQGKSLDDKISELNSNLDCGKATTTTVQNGVQKVNITFNKTFTSPPILTFSYITSQISTDRFSIANITATGASLAVYTTTTNHSVTFYWQAQGMPDNL